MNLILKQMNTLKCFKKFQIIFEVNKLRTHSDLFLKKNNSFSLMLFRLLHSVQEDQEFASAPNCKVTVELLFSCLVFISFFKEAFYFWRNIHSLI